MHFDEWSEHGGRLPLQVVGSHHLHSHFVFARARVREQFDLYGHFTDGPFPGRRVVGEGDLRRLRLDERLDEAVRVFGVERECVAQGEQLGTLLEEGLLDGAAVGVEVVLERVKDGVEDVALLRV